MIQSLNPLMGLDFRTLHPSTICVFVCVFEIINLLKFSLRNINHEDDDFYHYMSINQSRVVDGNQSASFKLISSNQVN